MKKEMLINVLQPEECRIAIVEDGVLEELYVERASQESYVGNIYKGRIVNIEPSIQAAFVDFGIGRNGFLHVSDVDPAYYKHLLSKEALAYLRDACQLRPIPAQHQLVDCTLPQVIQLADGDEQADIEPCEIDRPQHERRVTQAAELIAQLLLVDGALAGKSQLHL